MSVFIDKKEIENKELQAHFSKIREFMLKKNEPNKIMKFDLKEGDYFKFVNNPNLFLFHSTFLKVDNSSQRSDDLFERLQCYTRCNLVQNGRTIYSDILTYVSNLYEKVIKMDRDGFIKHYEEKNNIYNFNINEYITQSDKIKKDIENIGKLKVIECDRNNYYYYNSYKFLKEWYNNGGKTNYNPSCIDDIIIEKNQIQIPSWCNGYHYNTALDYCDKNFEIGDIVELKFKKNEMVKDEYRGKTIQFIINNKLVYKYYSHNYTRLALTPLTDNWTKDDIIIIDDCERIADLMVDLYPENRLEFQGWECKTVSIKVVDKSEKLPLFIEPYGVHDLMETFKHEDKSNQYYLKFSIRNSYDKYIINTSDNRIKINVLDVFSSNDNCNFSDIHHHSYTVKIVTRKDVENALIFLNDSLQTNENTISRMTKVYEANRKLIEACKIEKQEKIPHLLISFN